MARKIIPWPAPARTHGWDEFQSAIDKLRAEAEGAARLALLRKQGLRTGSETLPSAAELEVAVWRVTCLINAVHKRIYALQSAYLACDRRPATLARVRWEGERIVPMLRHAIAPVLIPGETPADGYVLAPALTDDLTAGDVGASPAGPAA